MDDDRALVRLHAVVPVPTPGAPRAVSAISVDAAGVVRRTGRSVARLVDGDRVFGRFIAPARARQTPADYRTVPQWWALAPMPPGLCFADAAACISPGLAALAAIDAVQPRPGDRVVVAPGAHPVSILAIQLARARGALVTTSAGTDQVGLLRSLGAIEIIDPGDGDLNAAVRRRHPRGVSAVIDVRGDSAAVTLRAGLLRPGGRLAALHGTPSPAAFARRRATAVRVLPRPTTSRLLELAAAIHHGRLAVGPLRHGPAEAVMRPPHSRARPSSTPPASPR